jgi:DNA polymerase-3 subunit epsilon
MQLMAIDTETTGLNVKEHELVSATFIKTDDALNEIDRLSIYVRPENWIGISYEALAVNGMSEAVLRSFPTQNEVKCAIYSFFDETERFIPLGHNYDFDKQFLIKFFGFDAYNQIFHYQYEDTQRVARYMQRRGVAIDNVSLGSLCNFFDVESWTEHRSDNDAEATLNIYKRMLERNF